MREEYEPTEIIVEQLEEIKELIKSLVSRVNQLSQLQPLEIEFLSIEETAERLSVTPQTIQNYIRLGKASLEEQGWRQGHHYVELSSTGNRPTYRIIWQNILAEWLSKPRLTIRNNGFHENTQAL